MNEEIPETSSIANGTNKITILIADDHPLFRKALRDILEQQEDFLIVAEAKDGEEAVRLAGQYIPDIVVMDITMPKLNGLEATSQIKAKYPNIAVLVLTVHDDDEHILRILEAGAAGYLTKSVFGKNVVATIRSLVTGETVIATAVFKRVLQHALKYIPNMPPALHDNKKLTAREMEILKLTAQGITNKDIALRLNLSVRTVKGYMVEIFSKLEVNSRTEAVITGLRSGLLNLDEVQKTV